MLQVVPPTTLKPTIPVATPTDSPTVTTKTAPPTTKTLHSSQNYLWLILIATIGISCLRFISVGSSVSGDSEITADISKMITMPFSGRLKEILVRTNQLVKLGQPLALVESEELNKDEAEAKRVYNQFQSEAAISQQQIGLMEANLKEVIAKQAVSHQKTVSLQQQMNQGNFLPQMQELQIQLEGINSEIKGFQDELDKVDQRIIRYQSLATQGALSKSKLEDEEKEQRKIKRQIEEKKYQAELKKAQMNGIREKLQLELRQQQIEENQSVAAVNSAMQQVKQAITHVQIRQQGTTQREKELQRVQNRKEDLIIKADKAGYVVTPDLDKKQNQYLQIGSPFVDIVNSEKLTVKVNTKQEDFYLVKVGQTVTFRPKNMGLLSYKGTVISKDLVASTKEPQQQQQPTFKITVHLNQGQNLEQLQPGVTGDAHIEVESMLLYQKLQRELEKIIPISKFF